MLQLVLFVKGLLSKLAFPYAQFASTDLSGKLMYDPVWEAVDRLELCSFKVLVLVCDGLAANRKLFRLHNLILILALMIFCIKYLIPTVMIVESYFLYPILPI